MTRVLSCIQPTGEVHLGNYLGALRNWVNGQHEADAFHGIVDLHALTVTEEPGVIGETTVRLAAILFAIGLDPDVATVFVQSHVVQHSQLCWVMECTVSFGELSRMTQFKEKSAKREGDFISAGLFTYPALQAADILLYDAEEVPVGEDQRQHIEITRDVAMRFNHRFGDTFVIPQSGHPEGRGSSDGPAGSDVEDEQVERHRRRVHHDDGRCLPRWPASSSAPSPTATTRCASTGRTSPASRTCWRSWRSAPIRRPKQLADKYTQYGPLKTDTGEAVVEMLRPIQKRYNELMTDRGELAALLRKGSDKAGAVAAATLDRAYQAIGFLPR